MDTLDRPMEWNLYKYAYTSQGGGSVLKNQFQGGRGKGGVCIEKSIRGGGVGGGLN